MNKKAKNLNKSKPITVTELVNRELNRIQRYVEKQEDIGFLTGGKLGKMIRNRKTRYTRKTLEKLKKIKAKEIKEQIYFETKDTGELVKASELNKKKYQAEKRETQIKRQIQQQQIREEKARRKKIHVDYENLDEEGVIDKYMQVFNQTINHVGYSAKFREILQRYGIFVIERYGRKVLAKAISRMYLTFTDITPKNTYEDAFINSFIDSLNTCVQAEIDRKDDRLKDYYESVTKPQIEVATENFFDEKAYDLDKLETAYRRKRKNKSI